MTSFSSGFHIGDLFGDRFKSKTAFKKAGGIISAPQTLLPPSWDNLRLTRCPFCGNRLSFMTARNMYLCKSKKHKKSFVIGREKLNRLFPQVSLK